MNSPKLIIFDCDGVLVDSEPITNQVLRDMLAELGLDLTLEDMFEHFMGHSTEHCIAFMADEFDFTAPEGFADEFRRRSYAVLREQVEIMPGVMDALSAIDVPSCVASSGQHAKIRTTLGRTGLYERFEGRIFSAMDVGRPKPAPDVFLHSARQCGVAPGACMVVEDTPVGIEAAVRAGMHPVGFAGLTPPQRLAAAGARHILSHMSELPALIRHLGSGVG